MASPDFREYIDLTVNDIQPDDIYNLAREYAINSLPEFDPRTGTVEDAMLQAMAFVSGLVTGAINRLPNSLIEGMLRLFGFLRREATFATGSVIFSAIDDAGLTIPGGTQVAYNEIVEDGSILHIFETAFPVNIDQGDFESGPVQIIATEVGIKPVIADEEPLTILTPIGRLLDARFDGALIQGEESESDFSFFNRASTYFASLSAALATAEQTTSYILTSYPDAYRVKAYDLTRLPVFRPSVIGFDGTDGIISIYPKGGSGTSYSTVEHLANTAPYVKLSDVPLASMPTVSASTIVRLYDSTESEYDGRHDVLSGSITDDVVRFTFTPTGTERRFFCFVRAATTSNLTSLSGVTNPIDGVTLIDGDLVLVKNQTTGSQNGIYLASASSWTRISELPNGRTVTHPIHVYVDEGTSNGDKYFATTNSGSVIINTTALVFAEDTQLTFLPKLEILDTVAIDAADVPGAVTIFVSDSTGASLTAEQKATIADDVAGRSVAGLSVYLTDVLLANIGINVTIGVQDGYSKLQVKDAVTLYLNNAISPLAFEFSPVIRKNILIANISRIDGVEYVESLSFTVDPDSVAIASVDPVTDDLTFQYVGVIPVADAAVGTI